MRTLLQLLTFVHIITAAAFFGSNLLLEFVNKRLEDIPPTAAGSLSEKLGNDITLINSTALVLLALSGFVRLFLTVPASSIFSLSFYGTGYGAALGLMMFLWLTVIVSSGLIIFYFRPQVTAKLPYDTSRQEVTTKTEASMNATKWMVWLGRYNLLGATLAILTGGFLRFGGF